MPATFGQMLIVAREKRGMSIDDAAHETRIPAQHLRHMESGNIAAFGSMTYARSFIRHYSEFLGVDSTSMLEGLPEGALGGERDYRYLTQSQGPWLREPEKRAERITVPTAGEVHTIKSPLPAAMTMFVLMLAGTAMWGSHMAEMDRRVEPSALKALPVEDDEPPVPAPQNAPVSTTNLKARHVSLPVRKEPSVN